MRAYCCQQWVGQLYYDCIQIQTISWSLPPSYPPSLSLEEVVQVQSQGCFPAPGAYFQTPSLRQTLLLPSFLYPNKCCCWLKAGRNGGWKCHPLQSPLPLCACPCSPKPLRGKTETGLGTAMFFINNLWDCFETALPRDAWRSCLTMSLNPVSACCYEQVVSTWPSCSPTPAWN